MIFQGSHCWNACRTPLLHRPHQHTARTTGSPFPSSQGTWLAMPRGSSGLASTFLDLSASWWLSFFQKPNPLLGMRMTVHFLHREEQDGFRAQDGVFKQELQHECTQSFVHLVHQIFIQGFPGGSVVKNPPANAGDRSSIPDPGRSHTLQSKKAHEPQLVSPHSGAQELSPCATTTEATRPRACALQQGKPLRWEAGAPQLESSPC